MAMQVVMPRLSDTMEEGKILRWLKREGDRVEGGEILAEIQTDKADIEMEAFGSGILRKILVREGESAQVGRLIGVIGEEGEDISALLPVQGGPGVGPARAAVAPPSAATAPPAAPADGARIKASPLARRIAREQGIDLSALKGSGPGGRVIRRDVPALAAEAGSAQRPAVRPVITTGQAPAAPPFEERELSPMRRAIATRMAHSMATAPHFYLTVEAAMEKAMALRESIREQAPELKVSVTDMLIKAAASALPHHPALNASFVGERIRYYSQVHIGIAVALEDGLITPVLRDCNRKSLAQIAGEAGSLIERARAQKLKPQEYSGGTFTISNLGMFEIDEFTAVINPPEAAILAVGSIQAKAVVVDGQIGTGHRMRMTLSCDHRVVDGATGARFLQEVKHLIEHPLQLVL